MRTEAELNSAVKNTAKVPSWLPANQALSADGFQHEVHVSGLIQKANHGPGKDYVCFLSRNIIKAIFVCSRT